MTDYTLYSSCEPCVMCAAAIVRVKLGRLVYSVSQEKLDSIAGTRIVLSSKDIFKNSFHKPEITAGILKVEDEKIFDGYVWA